MYLLIWENKMRIFEIYETLIYLFFRKIFALLPAYFSKVASILGYTQVIKRSEKVKFKRRIYNGRYHINVRGDYAVERIATQRKIDKFDPYRGIKCFDLRDSIALDIGANIGAISIGLIDCGCARVYSFEPGPLYQRLKANIELNGLVNEVFPFQIGLDEKDGNLFWAEDKNNPGNAHLINDINSINFEKITTKFDSTDFIKVPVVCLDDFVKENINGQIDIIKIDVEGMEWNVIKGGLETIRSKMPIVVAETHRVASDMMQYDCMTPMFNFFYELGYKTFSLDRDGELREFIYPNFGLDTFFVPERRLPQSLNRT